LQAARQQLEINSLLAWDFGPCYRQVVKAFCKAAQVDQAVLFLDSVEVTQAGADVLQKLRQIGRQRKRVSEIASE